MEIYSGPLQGYTDAQWRAVHAQLIGGIECYFTPFVRVEKGIVRTHDLRDATSPLNDGINTVAQIIFGSADEFRLLCDVLIANGVKHINLNIGCPFPPQMQRGRGAAMVADTDTLGKVAAAMREYSDIIFSVKMRLGRENANEWQQSIAIINSMPLNHITLHPRTGRQQYKGLLNLDEFSQFAKICCHPLVYNGDITSPAEAFAIEQRFTGQLHAIMIGRGLLARPTLAWEIANHELSEADRREAFMALHDRLYNMYSEKLSGDAHLLAKMRTVCEYAEEILTHKVAKAIRKAKSADQYLAAIAKIR